MAVTTLEEAKQFAFTKTVEGLHSQAWNQCGKAGSCKYASGPMRCAVGWLLNDPQSQDGMSGTAQSAMYVLGLLPELAEWLKAASEDEQWEFEKFLAYMVTMHDNPQPPTQDGMYEEFAKIGQRFALTWPLKEEGDA